MSTHLVKITAVAGALALAAANGLAQDAAAGTAAPPLSYGVSQVVQLSKANISDDTIISYIQNSGNSYGLDADQIIYLKEQGVSANVINAMINQKNRAVAVSVPTPSPAPVVDQDQSVQYAQPNAVPTTTPPPVVGDSAPSSTVYVIPDTQTYYYDANYAPYYYGYYGYGWPAVSLSFGWGYGGWGGYRGGWGGGWHGGGGGWHGGGGFHGGGGGRR